MFYTIIFVYSLGCALGSQVPSIRQNGKIVGGQSTSIQQHPYQVALLYENDYHNCGGSLISEKWVLTAAHCISSIKYFVRVGSTLETEGGVVHKAKNQYAHEKFNYTTVDYDYGLIELETPVQLSDSVKIVKLPEAGFELDAGTLLNVTGWGSRRSSTLQLVTVPFVEDDVCKESHPDRLISNQMFCAGSMAGGHGPCNGDSGGPVVSNGVQYGIVSWSYGCAQPFYPAVYAKVSAARDWIKNISGI
uniref:trypsin n=1 Tax=Xenopsylla cheopis TaxID=163159 RepID=A0A6M2E1M4_XENCH